MRYCVYIHSRPDGTPFYVGKGTFVRANELAPSRRTKHHANVVTKYGRENIRICVFPCLDEKDSFRFEVYWIKKLRLLGHKLINYTEGGEGASGRKMTIAQQSALEKGRGPGHFKKMSEKSQQNILKGLAFGRLKSHKTPAFKAHVKRISKIGAANLARIRAENRRTIICEDCGADFWASNKSAKCCSRLCEQRHRRARKAA